MTQEMKTCTVCGDIKPSNNDFFRKDARKKDGLASACKICKRKLDKLYCEKNKEKISRSKKSSYLKNIEENRKVRREYSAKKRSENPEKERERVANWCKKNPLRTKAHKEKWEKNNKDKIRIKNRRLYESKREEHLKACKKWRDENKPLRALYSRTRYARKMAAEGSHTIDDVMRLYQLQRGMCAYCGCDVSNGYQVDHIIPLAKGGSDKSENICISCKTCNQRKSDKMPWDFAAENWRLL
jgi:hypothetical protein